VSAAGDHIVDIVVERAPRAHDAGLEFAEIDIETEGFEDLVGPQRKLLPIFAWCTE
jgi:hypothetical protein